jgi:redox-sensitive bicupin YhaK (pirin superfamily)
MFMKHVLLIIVLLFGSMVHAFAQKSNTTYTADEVSEGTGAEVRRLFPASSFKHFDPFILLDDFSVQPPAGFPAHQHKGFEAITYMVEGGFIHKDNIGNNDTIFAGDAQRFTAGKGLIHSEMPGTKAINRGLQLWLNIPLSTKQLAPSYQLIDSDSIKIDIKKNSTVRTIAGPGSSLHTNCGCDLTYLDISLKNDSLFFSPSTEYSTFIYVLSGLVKINNTAIQEGQFYILENTYKNKIESSADARFVYLSAKPLNQPIKQRGPFVD